VETTQLIQPERPVFAAEIIEDAPTTAVSTVATPFWERRDFVLGLIAFSGPPGIVMLWLSRRFGSRTKALISAAYIALTIVLPIALIWYWCDFAMNPLVDALGKK
jgi:hypothetical protein